MKLTTKIAAGVFALALFGGALVGCSNSSDGFSLADLEKLRNPGNNQGKTSASVVLLEDSEGWTTDWDTKTFEAAKFADAVTGSQFKFTVSKNTDQYVKPGPDYSDCYSIIQLLDGEDKLTGGTIEGGEIEVAGGNLKPEYLLANGDPDYDESHVFTMIYTPSDAEIAILKTRGVGIQAHGTKIFKIEFVYSASSGENQQEEPAAVVLLNEVWAQNWNTKTFAAAKFADAVTGSQFKFTIHKNTDELITYPDGDENHEHPNYDECYSLIQLLDGDNKLTAGTITGGAINGENLEPAFVDANGQPDYDQSHEFTVVYTPSAAEVAILKERGVGIQAHGVKFTKIEFILNNEN